MITGGDALSGITALIDYAGQLRGQLNALIDAELARQQPPSTP